MTLDDIGNIGELIGSLAIVLSLLYVGIEVRRSSRITRLSTLQAHTDNTIQLLTTIGNSEQSARVLRLGLNETEELTDDQRLQFRMYMTAALFSVQNAYIHYIEGASSEHTWKTWLRVASFYLVPPGGQRWWVENKVALDKRFVEVAEERWPDLRTETD